MPASQSRETFSRKLHNEIKSFKIVSVQASLAHLPPCRILAQSHWHHISLLSPFFSLFQDKIFGYRFYIIPLSDLCLFFSFIGILKLAVIYILIHILVPRFTLHF